MNRKKALRLGLACVLAATLLVLPVSAHGGHGRHGGCHRSGTAQSAPAGISVCPFEDCHQGGRHAHDAGLYCGYPHEGGVCAGACCALCPLEDCSLTGRHTHENTLYCGNNHAAGFCDASCIAAALENGAQN
ncbi:MAG: hypothetical protein HFG26_05315 [Provencibacterium sp.]|jgi:hypothetical protein|nr:hypothetical protein [Provencibacterium sp.]